MTKKGTAHYSKKNPYLEHNDRTNDKAKTINKEHSYLNEYSCNSNEAKEKINQLYNEAKNNFYEYCKEKNGLAKSGKPKGLQNFTKLEKSYHEFIYEINENTTMEQCEKLTQQIAELTGFTPIQITIHKDEGHTNKQGEFVTHYHAHAVFFTLDKNTGLQLARIEASLTKENLSKIQDLTAEILQMQRGEKRFQNNIKQPNYIQNYKDYAAFKEQERKIQDEFNEKEAELKKEAHKLTELGLELKNKEKVISTYEKELKAEKNAFLKEKQEFESGHEQALNNLKSIYKKQYSLWKNLITFGKYNKKVDENYNIAKNALLASKKEADKMLEQKNKELERKERELQESKEQVRLERQKNNELQLQINRLIEKNKELMQELKKAEKEILRHIDFNAEVEYLRRNSCYNPNLSDIQQEAINNELTRRIQAKEKEQQRNQPKGYTLYR